MVYHRNEHGKFFRMVSDHSGKLGFALQDENGVYHVDGEGCGDHWFVGTVPTMIQEIFTKHAQKTADNLDGQIMKFKVKKPTNGHGKASDSDPNPGPH